MSVILRAATVCPIVEKIDSLHVSRLTTESVRQALEGLAQVAAWVDSQKLLLTRRLQELAADVVLQGDLTDPHQEQRRHFLKRWE